MRAALVTVLFALSVGCAEEREQVSNVPPEERVTDIKLETVFEGTFNSGTFVFESEDESETITVSEDGAATIVTIVEDETTEKKGRWERTYDGISISMRVEDAPEPVTKYYKGLETEGLTEKESGRVYARQAETDDTAQ